MTVTDRVILLPEREDGVARGQGALGDAAGAAMASTFESALSYLADTAAEAPVRISVWVSRRRSQAGGRFPGRV